MKTDILFVVIPGKKYPNLCRLCDNVNECSYNDAQEDRSLNCFLNSNADVVYTTLDTVTKISNYQDYKLLCPNGEYTNIAREIRSDCAWRNQPWTLIVARRYLKIFCYLCFTTPKTYIAK